MRICRIRLEDDEHCDEGLWVPATPAARRPKKLQTFGYK
uniref:Uncharacterized protein n=1 Tax=Variovorax paradoxus (strain S110) TaxID=543728 RepID=C5CZR6_VARPS